ncbi:Lysosomal acid lipase/cholesteryl ester hydrolase [Auxenochlorella protothecoides]|uniref:Lysosomal acid lipase/cholesteryl ester hydrolase n=1 Tax=Auxenochlorella protothecoides TaxID=3075 RepID=A0A087SC59_AUXPR|nr:Lysosomal acid lipase/cholesteryl ester hydrolase [Auxenochlorella protothecoides]KFM23313.1 Lysosomal acid lipase/cholesteryl ester hydrolase [Auxenochlorella protothecoides]
MPSRVGRRGRLVRLLLNLQALYTIVGAWISDNIVGPWTSLWEEITKAVVRGWIITWQRWLNAWSGILLALFPGARREVRGRPRAHSEAWGAWLKALRRDSGAGGLFQPLPTGAFAAKWEDGHVWTASDFVLRAGYPLEEHTVTTSDGYILTMHRIPRTGGKEVTLFQHGVLDTSLGWVANGSVGSQAFAAYDAGFDVWLGNSRSNAPRMHADRACQGLRYWHYSANEQAMGDVGAQVEHIHAVKMAELGGSNGGGNERERGGAAGEGTATSHAAGRFREDAPATRSSSRRRRTSGSNGVAPRRAPSADELQGDDEGESRQPAPPARDDATPLPTTHCKGLSFRIPEERRDPAPEHLPYNLQGVGHSLGAACLLMYVTVCRMQGRPHRLRRLVLMSPAGFHSHVPRTIAACKWLMPWAARLMDLVLPGRGLGLRLPSPFLRYVTFKLTLDLSELPALQSLVRRSMQALMSGDGSEWDLAMQMPHYNSTSMPAVSLHTGAHFGQWARDPAFRLFDHGSAAANRAVYAAPRPPSIAHNYRLLDVPVDLVAGTSDRVVGVEDVKMHARWLARSGQPIHLREFDVGHMDLTFAVKPELRDHVLRRLLRPL